MKIIEGKYNVKALTKLWVVYPGKKSYPLEKNVLVLPLEMLESELM